MNIQKSLFFILNIKVLSVTTENKIDMEVFSTKTTEIVVQKYICTLKYFYRGKTWYFVLQLLRKEDETWI